MPALKVISRHTWGARKGGPYSTQPTPKETFIHYSAGQGKHIDTYAEQKSAMSAIQGLHMNNNGWSDIGYHFVVFQPWGRFKIARVFQGRPLNAIPAAQAGHNTGTVAVCVVMQNGEKLKWQTKAKLRSLVRRLPPNVRGHYEVVATSCPGTALKAYLPTLRKAAKKRSRHGFRYV